MIIDELHQLSLGVTVRHSDSCDGTVTLTPVLGSINSLRSAEIVVTCSKCKTTTISHIARYTADADLLNISDEISATLAHTDRHISTIEKPLRALIKRLRERGETL